MDNSIVKQSELVIDALQYAHDHNLDIDNRDDVLKILEVIDPLHKEDPDVFMRLLKTSDVFMGMEAKRNEDKKTRLPN